MVSLTAFVHAIILLIVAGLVCWLLIWLVDYVGLPQPFYKIAKVVIAVGAVIVIIGILLSLAGYPVFRP